MQKLVILIFFLITSCGYQPLYKNENSNNIFKINEFKLTGNDEINKKIFSKIPFILDKNNKKFNKLFIESKKSIIETSKNSKGQVTSYRTIVNVNFLIKDKNNKILKSKTVNKQFSYEIDENKFKFKEYQMKIENNLIDRIIEEILVYLNY